MVPEALTRAAGISDRAVRLWLLLDRYAGDHEAAFPGRQRLADDLSCSLDTVDRAVAELIGEGWLVRELRPGRSSLYVLNNDPTGPPDSPVRVAAPVRPSSRTHAATGSRTHAAHKEASFEGGNTKGGEGSPSSRCSRHATAENPPRVAIVPTPGGPLPRPPRRHLTRAPLEATTTPPARSTPTRSSRVAGARTPPRTPTPPKSPPPDVRPAIRSPDPATQHPPIGYCPIRTTKGSQPMPSPDSVAAAAARRDVVVTRIAESIGARGYPPTVRELAEHTGVTKRTIRLDLASLALAGRIERDPGTTRGIRLV